MFIPLSRITKKKNKNQGVLCVSDTIQMVDILILIILCSRHNIKYMREIRVDRKLNK